MICRLFCETCHESKVPAEAPFPKSCDDCMSRASEIRVLERPASRPCMQDLFPGTCIENTKLEIKEMCSSCEAKLKLSKILLRG